MQFGLIIAAILFYFFITTWIVLNRIVKSGPNEVIIVSGRRSYVPFPDGSRMRVGYRMMHRGDRRFIWPFIERIDRLSLEPIAIDLGIPKARTSDGASLTVDALGVIRIGEEKHQIALAARHFLSMNNEQIGRIAVQVIEGRLRNIFNTITTEELDRNRNGVSEEVRQAAGSTLADMGVELVTFAIRAISEMPDESLLSLKPAGTEAVT
jgi:flotillin